MNKYESIIILEPETDEETIKEITRRKVRKIIEEITEKFSILKIWK